MKLPELTSFNNISIIQTAFLGDVALSVYLAQTIKNYHPESELIFVTTPAASPMIASVPAIDNIITYDKRNLQNGWRGIKFIAQSLADKQVDCLISLHRSLRTTLVSFLARPVYSVAFNNSSLSFLYDKRIKYLKSDHEIDRNLSLLKGFSDFENIQQAKEVILDISVSDKSYIDSKLNWMKINSDEKIIAIAPGSVWETKKWKKEHFAELAKTLSNEGHKCVFIGSESDSQLCRELANETGNYSLAGDVSIPQTLYFLSLCTLTITNDSAPTHFAGLVQCPTLTIYGATSPIFGFSPRGEFDQIAEVENLKCKPCAIHGGNKCPKKTFDCMEKLAPDMVYQKAVNILSKVNGL